MISPQQPGHPALKWGLIFGGILALLSIASSTLQLATGAYSQLGDPSASQAHLGTTLLLGCGGFIVEAALYFFAGMLAARANGKVGAGALAGLIAAAIGSVIGGVISIFVLTNLSLTPPPGAGIDPVQYTSLLRTIIIIAAIGGIVIGLGIGTGIAALGGLVGRGQYESAHPLQPMAGSMYTPLAPVGAPYPYTPPTANPAGGLPGAYPPPDAPPAGAPYQYPPAPGAYPPPPETPRYPQQPQ
jgi:hypothetical protein